MIDAQVQWRPERSYTVQLIDRAQQAAGSRNKLCVITGINRRKLGRLEAGDSTMSFAEQVILEAVADGQAEAQS